MTELPILLSATLGLFLGPALILILGRRRWWLEFVDGYILVSIGGIGLLHLLPKCLVEGGAWAAGAACIGLLLPYAMERRFATAHGVTLWLLLLGLIIHAAFDGAVLLQPHHHHLEHLGVAVVLHRLPVGVLVYVAVAERRGAMAALGVVAVLGAATFLGYFSAEPLLAASSTMGVVIFNSFVVGALLHVLVHAHGLSACGHPHGHDQELPSDRAGALSGGSIRLHIMPILGALFGALTVLQLDADPAMRPAVEGGLDAGTAILTLALALAPALLCAYAFVAVLIAVLGPWAAKWLRGGAQISQGFRGMAYGVSSPVSPCDLLSRYELLLKGGIPATTALAFLVGTPGLGLEALLISVPLLGNNLTVARVVASLLIGLIVSWTVGQGLEVGAQDQQVEELEQESQPPGILGSIRFGFGELVDHTLPWVLLGLGASALVVPLLDLSSTSSPGVWGFIRSVPTLAYVPLAAALGFPFYLCGAGATVIASIGIYKGVSAGAALAFLLLGPAVHNTTLSVLRRLHGRWTSIRVVFTAFLVAVVAGWFVDALLGGGGMDLGAQSAQAPTPIEWCSLVGLGVLFAISLVRQGPRGFLGQIFHPTHNH